LPSTSKRGPDGRFPKGSGQPSKKEGGGPAKGQQNGPGYGGAANGPGRKFKPGENTPVLNDFVAKGLTKEDWQAFKEKNRSYLPVLFNRLIEVSENSAFPGSQVAAVKTAMAILGEAVPDKAEVTGANGGPIIQRIERVIIDPKD
jgi:hypothetical protein